MSKSDHPKSSQKNDPADEPVLKRRSPQTSPSAPAASAGSASASSLSGSLNFEYRKGVPLDIQQRVESQLNFSSDSARNRGALGFMARALVLATMPYKDPKSDAFTRRNGDFVLRIVAGYAGGIPYGIYPRLLMSWLVTEAVRTRSPRIELGHSLSDFVNDVIDTSKSGGIRGTSSRVSEQIKRLFGSLISAHLAGDGGNAFTLRNVMIAESLELYEREFQQSMGVPVDAIARPRKRGITTVEDPSAPMSTLWTPQDHNVAGTWRSNVVLTDQFFQECVNRPVPIDLQAYKSLRNRPMAMDLYTFLTYRMAFLRQASRPIPWLSLMNQFGANFGSVGSANEASQPVRDFKKAFVAALADVQRVYPSARYEVRPEGFVLLPSPPHISRPAAQTAKIAQAEDAVSTPVNQGKLF